jgi:hypothetical protein
MPRSFDPQPQTILVEQVPARCPFGPRQALLADAALLPAPELGPFHVREGVGEVRQCPEVVEYGHNRAVEFRDQVEDRDRDDDRRQAVDTETEFAGR